MGLHALSSGSGGLSTLRSSVRSTLGVAHLKNVKHCLGLHQPNRTFGRRSSLFLPNFRSLEPNEIEEAKKVASSDFLTVHSDLLQNGLCE